MTHAALLLSLLVVMPMAAPASSRAATFSLRDDRAAREISESTQLYIDGRLEASFHLDEASPRISLSVSIDGHKDQGGHEEHDYVLCGTITVRNAQGAAEIHEVNSTGRLHDPDGHAFEALGANDFTLFYLTDPVDPAAADSLPQHSGLCRSLIS